jgi:hypothetical protein
VRHTKQDQKSGGAHVEGFRSTLNRLNIELDAFASASERIPATAALFACTKTSLPPPSGAMKPGPFGALKNFAVLITNCSSCVGVPHERMLKWRESTQSPALQKFGCLSLARNAYESGRLTVALHPTERHRIIHHSPRGRDLQGLAAASAHPRWLFQEEILPA